MRKIDETMKTRARLQYDYDDADDGYGSGGLTARGMRQTYIY